MAIINYLMEALKPKESQKYFYHGTNNKFDNFDKNFIGSQTDDGLYGRGFYFATTPEVAKNTIRGKSKYIVTTKLNIQNPLNIAKYNVSELADYLDMDKNSFVENRGICKPLLSYIPMFTRAVKDKGHDSVYVDRGGNSDEVVVFSPEDIEIIKINDDLNEDIQQQNTIQMWHGGNLDDYSDVIAQKNGRQEFGAGLYATTSYNVVEKYKKGSY